MAMDSGESEDAITAINVTPLVDICLVLVIIFMAIAPFAMTIGIKVLQSHAKTAEGKASVDENVQVKLNSAGIITVNGVPVVRQDLEPRIIKALAASKDKMVIITADEENRVGQVVDLLDTAQQSGALKLAILKSQEGRKG